MKAGNYTVTAIGLMSGTSLDGLDLACCSYKLNDGNWEYECLATSTVDYPEEILESLNRATTLSGEDLSLLDKHLGEWYGEQINAFIKEFDLKVDLIASHGHTVFHQPEKKFTLQIGSGLAMQLATGVTVINDFRSKDVALGGQGAPLVPVGDKLLFHEFDYCLNLGGIANISTCVNNKHIAFDIAPCNMVLNRLVAELGLKYDDKGVLAGQGGAKDDLLEQLNNWSYYKQSYPKSLGYEHVRDNIFPIIDNSSHELKDKLATYVVHLAKQIASSVKVENSKTRILATGGGAYNQFLIDTIGAYLPPAYELVIPDKQLVGFKEAIVFGFLGVLRIKNEINCLASVTGASTDSCSGVIYE